MQQISPAAHPAGRSWGELCQQFRKKIQHPIAGTTPNSAHEVQSIKSWKLPDRNPQPLTAKSQCPQQNLNEHQCRMWIQSTQWAYPLCAQVWGRADPWHRTGHPILQSWGLAKTITAYPMLLCPHFLPQQSRGWSEKQIWGISISTQIFGLHLSYTKSNCPQQVWTSFIGGEVN